MSCHTDIHLVLFTKLHTISTINHMHCVAWAVLTPYGQFHRLLQTDLTAACPLEQRQ